MPPTPLSAASAAEPIVAKPRYRIRYADGYLGRARTWAGMRRALRRAEVLAALGWCPPAVGVERVP